MNLAAFVDFPDTGGYSQDSTLADGNQAKFPTEAPRSWRIDGATFFGTEFYAVPTFLLPGLVPKQIHVRIPTQLQWPAAIRCSLDAIDSAHQCDSRVQNLGIADYLVLALTHRSSTSVDWVAQYQALSFGSSIVLDAVKTDPIPSTFKFDSAEDAWGKGCTLSTLQSMWGLSDAQLPQVLHLDQLQFLRQLTENVVLVKRADQDAATSLVLKTPPAYTASIYHELKTLLTLPQHPSLPARPQFIVTVSSRLHDAQVICGFVPPYYPKGSMDDALSERRLAGKLDMKLQLSWCLDITRALTAIQDSGLFYSDLKMDNVVLSGPDGQESAVLIDFELDRNIFAWSPPEILAVEWIGELAAGASSLPKEISDVYRSLIERYLQGRGMSFPPRGKLAPYDNPRFGYYFPWIASTAAEREAGMVYCLGKAMWCICEGVGEVSNILGRSAKYESPLEFPDFQRTSATMQKLIRACTAGSREWHGRRLGIYRQGGRIYPRNASGHGPKLDATVEETEKAIKHTWKTEVEVTTAILNAKVRLDTDAASQDDMLLLQYHQRPTLEKVLRRLEYISIGRK